MLIAVLAGLRADELIRTNIGDIRPTEEGGVVQLRGKGNEDRRIPVERPLIASLRRTSIAVCRASRAAPNGDMSPAGLLPGPPLPRSSSAATVIASPAAHCGPRVLRAFKKAGVDSQRARGVLVHGFRHTFATELANENVSVYALMKVLGHDSMATSQRYVDGAGT